MRWLVSRCCLCCISGIPFDLDRTNLGKYSDVAEPSIHSLRGHFRRAVHLADISALGTYEPWSWPVPGCSAGYDTGIGNLWNLIGESDCCCYRTDRLQSRSRLQAGGHTPETGTAPIRTHQQLLFTRISLLPIQDSVITSRGALIRISGVKTGANVTIGNVTGTALDPEVTGVERGAFVFAQNVASLVIKNCTMTGVSFGVELVECYPIYTGDIK